MQKSSLMLSSALLALAMTVSIPALAQDIDFGDDTSRWANDGQCDDPRFEGPGAATIRSPSDLGHDATDCRTAFEAGEVTLVTERASPTQTSDTSAPVEGDIDFGDDSGSFANDGECDDPRFGGSLNSHRLHDATDCRTAYEAGDVTYRDDDASQPVVAPDEIDFGDDSGAWANDGECDDPRFGGSLDSHRLKDATDCREAYEAGEVAYIGGDSAPATPIGDIDFGDDSGAWANDGECDDPRFGGSLDNHRLKDATDCREAYEAGEVTYIGNTTITTTPSISMSDIEYGDDSGNWANDGECDDPRFVGPGTGAGLSDHERADASDCRAAVEAGRAIVPQAIDFGDDSGVWANDNECDDPRFYGIGSGYPDEDHIRADATDCRTAFEAGDIDYLGEDGLVVDGVNYGNDSGQYANDNECDDARFSGEGMGASLSSHIMADATDCRAAMEAGTITLGEAEEPTTPSSNFRINFGDDSGDYPNDGECDDPRFQGRGAAMELYDRNILRDASDCRAAYDAGTVTYQP